MVSVKENKLIVKVLIITGSYPPMRCGVGDYSHNLANALATVPGVSVGVLTSSDSVKEGRGDVVEIFPILKGWHLTEALVAVKLIRRWSPDIVHIQYPTQGYGNGFLPYILPIISFFMRKKVVQTWHEIYHRLNIPIKIGRAHV